MNSYIKPPSLSTSFSENGEIAKKRFDNILNTKVKKTGAIAFALVLMLIAVIGTMVACNNDTNILSLEEKLDSGIEIKITSENDISSNIYLLHDSDLIRLINELNAGNARYITINDKPVNATTPIDSGYLGTPTCIIKAWEINNENSLYDFITRDDGFLKSLKAYKFDITVDKFTDEKQIAVIPGDTSFTKEKYITVKLNSANSNRTYDNIGNIVYVDDILNLKNELYQYGAKGITINDIPILGDTYITDTIFINGTKIFEPYIIKAYGNVDAEKLKSSDIIKQLTSFGIKAEIERS